MGERSYYRMGDAAPGFGIFDNLLVVVSHLLGTVSEVGEKLREFELLVAYRRSV
jgi:hypothetical protein